MSLSSDQTVPTDRSVRVFISSTFRDMHGERGYLVSHVFPELKRRCRERGVEFTEVDLRWGVTQEQVERGEVLPICLTEIEHCRPYFIGLLGERYGWVPDGIDEELEKDHSWLKDHEGRSVTELEILHGVLNNPEMAGRSFFYFRDPAYIDTLPPGSQNDYRSESPELKEKLDSLKERIRSQASIVMEGYADPEAAGQAILGDLWQAIDREFPAGEEPTPLEREAADHEAFARSRAKVYIGREEYFDRLDEHIEGDGPPLVVLGESGSGKSALLSNWAIKYREEHPEDFVLLHFIGSTQDSSDYVSLLRRIMEEIRERYEPEEKEQTEGQPLLSIVSDQAKDEIPSDPEKVMKAFPLWLAKAAAKGRLVLVLDALNQLEDRDNAPDLGWLPSYFPPNVRVVLSTLPGRSLEALENRGWPMFRVEPLASEERSEVIVEYLGQYRKSLEPARVKRIADADQSSNPLYLRALLEELRLFGIYEELDARIAHYLEAQTIDGLYGRILGRLEEDYEKERPGLVGEAMGLLWAARRGLSEGELLELLDLPHALWSPLHLALYESLVSRSGFWTFFHDYLRKAVEDRYLSSEEKQKAAHLRLAEYFEGRELDERKVDELPWQLQQAECWDRLKDCIADPYMFVFLYTEAKQYELVNYWLSIGDRFDMVTAYKASLDFYEKTDPLPGDLAFMLDGVAGFLGLNARFEDAQSLYQKALGIRERMLGKDHPDTVASLNRLALLLNNKGDFNDAQMLHERVLEIRERTLGKNHPDTTTSINNLALLLQRKGDYDKAQPLFERALEMEETIRGENHPYTATSLNNLAVLLDYKGDYDAALPLHERALDIRERVLGKNHPQTAGSINNLAWVLGKKGNHDAAQSLHERALEIHKRALGEDHPETAIIMNNLAGLLDMKGDYDGAQRLHEKALEIKERTLGIDHPETAQSLNNLGVALSNKGDYEAAERLYIRALDIYERTLVENHPDTAATLFNLAHTLTRRGDYDGAQSLHEKALTIREKVLGEDNPDSIESLSSLARLMRMKGDYSAAEPLYHRSIELNKQVHGEDHPDTIAFMNELAEVLFRKGDYLKAEPYARSALQGLISLSRSMGCEQPGLNQSYHRYGACLQAMGLSDVEIDEKLKEITGSDLSENTIGDPTQEEEDLHSDLITLENLSTELLKSIYDSASMETKLDEQGSLQVHENSAFCYVFPSSEAGRIQLAMAFKHNPDAEREALLEFVNRVNSNFVVVRASVTDQGTIHFDHDISVDGGITKKALVLTTKRFLKIPQESIGEFGSHLV